MFNFKNKLKEAGLSDRLVCLVNSKRINKDDLIHTHWKLLKDEYQQVDSTIAKVCCSVTNAIIHQQRIHFFLNRETLRNLITNDKNHEYKPGQAFDNTQYPIILAFLMKIGLIERVSDVYENHYKLINQDVLNILQVDEATQKAQVEEYIRKNDRADRLADGLPDGKTDLDKVDIKDKEDSGNKIPEIVLKESTALASRFEASTCYTQPSKEIHHPVPQPPLPLTPKKISFSVRKITGSSTQGRDND